MPRSATDRGVLRETFARSYAPEVMEHAEVQPAPGDVRGVAGPPSVNRNGPRLWSVVALSVMGSAAAMAAVGCFSALVYPILKELRAERVIGRDGTEERVLGFWTILVLSVLVGCICCVLSWTLTYLDAHQPATASPPMAHVRDTSGYGFHTCNGVAVLNGVMAMLTVIWSLT